MRNIVANREDRTKRLGLPEGFSWRLCLSDADTLFENTWANMQKETPLKVAEHQSTTEYHDPTDNDRPPPS